METQPPRLKQIAPVLVLVAAGVVLALALWRAFGGTLPLSPAGYRVDIPLPQASNLHPGADVRVSGVNVGEVVAVNRRGRTARATIELQGRYAPLKSDARATLRTKTLLGEGFLEITLGSRAAAILPEGAQLAPNRVHEAQRLEDVLQTFAPETRRRLRQALHGLQSAFDGQSEALSGSLARAAPVTADFRKVADRLATQRGDLTALVANAGDVFTALGEREGTLQAAVRSGNRMLSVTAERDRALAATVSSLPPFLRQLRTSSRHLDAASGELHRAVDAVRPAVPELQPALDELKVAAPEVRRLFARLPRVIRSGNRGLPALRRILNAAPPVLAGTYPALRDVIPVLELLGVNRESVTTTLANVAQVHNGTYVGPGDRVYSYASGLINVWNETVAGWTERLPSHRGNTYPKPGYLTDFPQGLKSFDCRHTDNPPLLPPLGGTPPCRVQGPWTFNGKTAYFPRLERAGP